MNSRPDPDFLFDYFNRFYFEDEISKIPVIFNKRLRSSAGRCKGVRRYDGKIFELIPRQIDIHVRLFDHIGWDFQREGFSHTEFEVTLLHEMVHAFMWQHYNCNDHGPKFQKLMKQITGVQENHTYHSLDVAFWSKRKKRQQKQFFNPFGS